MPELIKKFVDGSYMSNADFEYILQSKMIGKVGESGYKLSALGREYLLGLR